MSFLKIPLRLYAFQPFSLSLERFDAIALDIGLQDGLLAQNRELSEVLKAYGIEHSFETYEGDHTNKVAERYGQHVLPFFSRVLDFE